MYERAAIRYTDNGLANNAIALYNKILRNAPGRTEIYLKLAELMIERGFAVEARNNFLEYAERMEKDGRVDEAFAALKKFADSAPDSDDIRLMLAEQFLSRERDHEAREQLAKLWAEVQASGDERRSRTTIERMKAISPDFDPEDAPEISVKSKYKKTSDIVFLDLDTDEHRVPEARPAEKPAAPPPIEEPVESPPALEIEPTVEEPEKVDDVETLEIEGSAIDGAVEIDESAVGSDSSLEIESASLDDGSKPDAVESLDGLDTIPQFEVPEDVGSGEVEGVEKAPEGVDEVDVPRKRRTSLSVEQGDYLNEIGLEEDAGESDSDAVEADTETDAELVAASEGSDETDDSVVGDPDLAGALLETDTDDLDMGSVDDLDLSADVEIDLPDVGESEELSKPTISDLEGLVADEPEDPARHRALAEALVEAGEMERAMEEFDLAIAFYERASDYDRVVAICEEVLRLDPNSLHHHHKRVTASSNLGDRKATVNAYLGYADAMLRADDLAGARSAYKSVLEVDPDNPQALSVLESVLPDEGAEGVPAETDAGEADDIEVTGVTAESDVDEPRATSDLPLVEFDDSDADDALDSLAPVAEESSGSSDGMSAPDVEAEPEPEPEPEEPARPAAPDFVNLGDLVFDEEEYEMDTRMTADVGDPTGDEQADFKAMLSEFKKGISENISEEDSDAHYDLGVAFKEMGLLDEAISEFQKALRSSSSKLKAAEALGTCFFEKGQFSVASTVLKRAVDGEAGTGDQDKIGLLYWLGRCEEEKNNPNEANDYYQRVFAVDIHFQDVQERVKKLA